MVKVSLPDGSSKELPSGLTLSEIAEAALGPGSADIVAARVDGQAVDLACRPRDGDIVEPIRSGTPEGLSILRHSAAHVMAEAVLHLFPDAKFAIGPAIEDGFYYDFDLPVTLHPEDLPRIEAEMNRIVGEKQPFERQRVGKDEASRTMRQLDQTYKVELMEEVDDEEVTFYRTGSFLDFCLGPHVPNTGSIGAFKLLRVAGAYWRGDSSRKMLQRIYGTAFPSKEELDHYLRMKEEAAKRDHRRIGIELDLFSFHEEAPGCAFWHPKGAVLFNNLLEYWRSVHRKAGYVEVRTPNILDVGLWHRSGHWENFREHMYFVRMEERDFAVKPMSCPGGLLIYNSRAHSYRDLPWRVCEVGTVYRHELSGVLSGLFRVRHITQDDAHIYCTPEQVVDELAGVIDLTISIYRDLGFPEYEVKLSTRPTKAIGTDEMWQNAEDALRKALGRMGIEYEVRPGEGAFYGPKIDWHLRDSVGRTWQCGTIQLDFAMVERFGAKYVASDGQERTPLMIHRAILGSFERFIGILIEHYAGDFPLWLAPVQVRVIAISDTQADDAAKTLESLKAAGIRAEADLRQATLGSKIREATLQKIPYMLILGEKEVRTGTVAVRARKKGDQGASSPEDFLDRLRREIAEKK